MISADSTASTRAARAARGAAALAGSVFVLTAASGNTPAYPGV
jgi:hypothetical protein